MNLTFYVVVIAFIFALFYLCSRDSSEDEEHPSTVEEGQLQNRTVDYSYSESTVVRMPP